MSEELPKEGQFSQNLNQPQAQSPTIPEPAKSGSVSVVKYLLFGFLGLSLLTISAYGGYWYGTRQVRSAKEPTTASQPTSTPVAKPTAGWKIYTNSENGYFVRYPADWIVQETESSVSFQPGPHTLEHVWIEVRSNPKELLAQDWIREEYLTFADGSQREGLLASLKPESVGELTMWRLSGIPSRFGQTAAFILSGKWVYILQVEPTGSLASSESHLIVFDQILSTFKFLE